MLSLQLPSLHEQLNTEDPLFGALCLQGVDSLDDALLLPGVLFVLPALHEVEPFVSHLLLLAIALVFVVADVVVPHTCAKRPLCVDEVFVHLNRKEVPLNEISALLRVHVVQIDERGVLEVLVIEDFVLSLLQSPILKLAFQNINFF